MPALLDQLNLGRVSIEKLAAILSENAARRFGLYPQKGAFRVGSDADLALVDLKQKGKVSRKRMFTTGRAVARIFEGQTLQGWPVVTIVRRKTIMRNGRFADDAFGWGRFVKIDKQSNCP